MPDQIPIPGKVALAKTDSISLPDAARYKITVISGSATLLIEEASTELAFRSIAKTGEPIEPK